MLTPKNVHQRARACSWRRLYLFIGVLLLTAGIVCGLMFETRWRAFAAPNAALTVSSPHARVSEAQAKANYGKLPLSFEANAGQFDSRVRFASRGQGYDLFLTSEEAVLALAGRTFEAPEGKKSPGEPAMAKTGGAVLRMKLVGANRDPKIEGLEELAGKINYFIGSDPAKWQTDVALYSKVQYKDVYRGIDLVYYGNQSQLEYDFVVAPGVHPRAIKLRFEGTEQLAVNKAGELTLGIPGGEVSMRRPVIFQLADDGTRRQVEGRYAIKGRNEVGFEVEDFDASRPLVIDPILSYSTYLGTGSNETGNGIAVDAEGNAYVTGSTGSFTFPVTGTTFTTPTGSNGHAFVTKLNPTGSALVYSTYVGGGRDGDIGYGIALDASRNAYVVGRTDSNDFPTLNAVKSKTSLYKSVDGAQQWANNTTGLDRDVYALAVDPTTPTTVYAGTISGVYKSTDAGANWQRAKTAGFPSSVLLSLAVYPAAPATLYAGTINGGLYRSTDRGENWAEVALNPSAPAVREILFDPSNASTIYLGTSAGVYKSTDSGASWTLFKTGLTNSSIQSLAIDALAPSNLYAGTFGGGLFKSTNGGMSWAAANNGINGSFAGYVTAIAVDPTNSSTIYAGAGYSQTGGGIFKSTDGGGSWSAVNNGFPNFQIDQLIVSASAPATVYAATTGGGVVKTTNGGASWALADRGLWSLRVNALVAADASASTLYIGTSLADAFDYDGFLFKLNAAGNALVYSTYLGGTNFDAAAGVAVDGGGQAVVTGNTSSSNFPTRNARQPALSGTSDAFIAKFNPTGAALVYSTYLGGGNSDEAGGVAVDASGNAYVTGFTTSTNFPVTPGAFQTTAGSTGFFGNGDAFVTKLDPAGASFIYSTYLGGTNGVDAGHAIAVDGAGHAFVAGYTEAANFPVITRFQPGSGVSGTDAFAAKLNPSGSGLIYSSTFGGSTSERARGIALDADANAYITGTTASTNFPLVAGALKNKSSLFKSIDGGTSWSNDNYGLNGLGLVDLQVDPLNPTNVYGATGEGVYKSTDGGRNWSAINSGLTSLEMSCLAIDPKTPSTIYAGTHHNGFASGDGIFKSTNGGASWTRINNGLIGSEVSTLTIDPLTPTTIYATNASGIFRSTNGGANWTRINTDRHFVISFVIDPKNTSIIYLSEGSSPGGVSRSTDGGLTWKGINDGLTSPHSNLIAIDPVTPTTLYVSTGGSVFKSTDSGTTWVASLSNTPTGSIAVDPANPATLYVASPVSFGNAGRVLRSSDGGATWKEGGSSLFYGVGKLVIDPLNPGTIFTLGNPFGFDDDAFVTKVNAAGTALVYSTYLGGGSRQSGGDDSKDAGNGIATDGHGNAYVIGTTRTHDFPVTPDAYQPTNRGSDEVFIAKLEMSFIISGQVSDAGGVPQSGVKITLSGARTDSFITAGDGRYSFVNLQRGSSYTISATRPGFTFAPPGQTFDNLNGDATLNFMLNASTVAFHNIAGRIVESDGTPLAGAQVSLGGSQIEFTTTDANGVYTFTAPQNGNYTVTPSKLGFSFSPPGQSFVNLDANRTADFNATRLDFVVTNTKDHGTGTLRQAILDANATSGANTITFNIPQPGVQTISLTSPLPTITDPVVINAATQPGFGGTPLVELDGSNVGLSASGLRITTSNCVVRGLAINRFSDSGILIMAGANNRIEGNFIGLDPSGTIARANKGGGIFIASSSSSNLIGGTTAAARNVISGNLNSGISLIGYANQIKGNFIGTDAAGLNPLGNGRGIDIYNIIGLISSDNVIGGTEPGARNIISGNSNGGIQTSGSGTIIQGNYIGTDVSGSARIGNSIGIYFNGQGTVIGGTTPAARNLISGNGTGIKTSAGGSNPPLKIQGNYIGTNAAGTAKVGNGTGIVASGGVIVGGTETGAGNLISGNDQSGVYLESCCNQLTVAGNFIGTDASGNLPLGNAQGVLVAASRSVIGGTTTEARNVISGNETGIQIGGPIAPGPVGNVVQGNLIGMNAAGTAPLPNTLNGINFSDSSGNTIGGSVAGAANIIAFSGGAGVAMSPSSINNAIRRNRIFSNAGPGIDLSPAGVTPNDAGDADSGANMLQNFPLVTAVTRGAQSTGIEGTLNSQPGTVFTIEVFSNSACDGSGSGEGAQFFHAFEATTDATGAALLNSSAPHALPAGRVLTMTATDPAGNTSEFSPCQAGEARGSVEFGEFAYNVLEDIGQARITINRVGGSRGAITVGYSTADQTATAGSDYNAISGTLTFAEGETSKTLSVAVFEDGAVEPEERAVLTLTADEPETIGGKRAAVLSIFDSNTPLTFSLERQSFAEGHTGSSNAHVIVNLSAATGRTATLDFSTTSGTALSGSDFQAAAGTLTFAPGTTAQTVNVLVNGDIFDEADETFRLLLSNPTNALVLVNNVLTIVDDDEPPAVSIGDVSVSEGNSGTQNAVFNVTLSAPSGKFLRVQYTTANGTATAGTDFTPAQNFSFIEFSPGQTTKPLTVQVIGDTTVEADETFFVNLSNPFNATIIDAQGTGTIRDDDGTPVLFTIGGRVRDESGNGVGDVTITLGGSRAAAMQTAADGQFFLRDLPAGGNYVVTPSKAGHVFEPAQLRFDALSADTTAADFISLSAPATLRFSAANFTSGEDAGRARLSVTREGNTNGTLTVEFSTTDDPAAVPCDPTIKRPDGTPYPQGVAYARCDYATTIDTLTFAPGESTKEIHVSLVDDAHVEGDERLQLRLRNATGATLVEGQSSATLNITDNDTTAGQPNPILSTPLFVRMHYLDFLSREPEPNEPWSRILNTCPNAFNLDPHSLSAGCDRLIVSQSFFGSQEFRLKGFFVYNFYRVAFDRRPEYAEVIPDMSAVSGATAAEVYARRAALPVNFTARAEFKARFDALSDTAYVNALLDRYALSQVTTPDPQNPEGSDKVTLTRAQLIARLSAGGTQRLTRAQVLRAIVESDEVGRAEYNGAFVAMQYYGYLRRTPEESGYQAWLRVINEDPNNVRIMVNGFVNSTEYRLRFGQP
jgi:photosystem II stability/assembly factor-like uncharacterized protein